MTTANTASFLLALAPDAAEYRKARNAYREVCSASEASREVAVSLRASRFARHQELLVAAENMLMTAMTHFEVSMRKMGVYDLYSECTSGNGDAALKLRLADETCKLLPQS